MRTLALFACCQVAAACSAQTAAPTSCPVAIAQSSDTFTVSGVHGQITMRPTSQAASDFGPGVGSGGFYVFIAAGDNQACLPMQQARASNGRTILWIEWGDDKPRSVSIGEPTLSVQLVVEDGSNNYATPTAGDVVLSSTSGGRIAGSYQLTFEGGGVSGTFDAPVCGQQCWP